MDDLAARLLVDCVRRPGLSLVHQELLDFAGHEFHTVREPGLPGRTFDEAARACPVSTAVGIVHADGTLALNPPRSTRILADDTLLVIAEDERSTRLSATPAPYDPTALTHAPPETPGTPNASSSSAGTAGPPDRRPPGAPHPARLAPRRRGRAAHRHRRRRPDRRRNRRRATGGAPPAQRPHAARDHRRAGPAGYDAVIVLGPDHRPGRADPDDRTLVTLLHLRAGEQESGGACPSSPN
ncbi:hypothetical protein O1L60_01895 [Streptomyces diastatochromogenes]|nr:hypothetical protein [Streptomyces diastatochromogenes]